MEQAGISGANFLLNIALVRALSLEGYGAFAVGFAGIQVVTLAFNAIVVEPLMISDPPPTGHALISAVRGLERVTAVLGLCIALTVGTVFYSAPASWVSAVWVAVAGGALSLLPQLLLLLLRRSGYLAQIHRGVAIGALTYLGITTACVVSSWLDVWRLSVGGGFFVLSGASLGAALVVNIFLVRACGGLALPVFPEWRRHATYGGWAAPAILVGYIPGGLYTFLIPAMMGLVEVGRYRAILNLAIPGTQLAASLGQVVLPEFASRRFDVRRLREFFWGVSKLSLALLAVLGVVTLLFGQALLQLAYGPGKVDVSLADLALVSVIPITYLQVTLWGSLLKATGHPRGLLSASVAGSLASGLAGPFLVLAYGATGALLGSASAYLVWGSGLAWRAGGRKDPEIRESGDLDESRP